MRSLVNSNCVNVFALTRLFCAQCILKPENMLSLKHTSNTNTHTAYTLRLCVRFKCATFYRRFQSFQSLFNHCSLVSIAIKIYFNRLQVTGAVVLNYFVFESFYLLLFLTSIISESNKFVPHENLDKITMTG